jgi:hypothetical protein
MTNQETRMNDMDDTVSGSLWRWRTVLGALGAAPVAVGAALAGTAPGATLTAAEPSGQDRIPPDARPGGDAVDIGPSDATAWQSEQGDHYGLCQIYGNEPWHYELVPEADDDSCPAMCADPTQHPEDARVTHGRGGHRMLDIVTELLADAGQVLIAHRSAERTIERKSSHWNLVSDADRAAEEYAAARRWTTCCAVPRIVRPRSPGSSAPSLMPTGRGCAACSPSAASTTDR